MVKEYKPIWYKSEFMWLIISLVLQLITFSLVGVFGFPEFLIWVGLIGTAYSAYFVIKGIIYAWIINPYNAWKRKRK